MFSAILAIMLLPITDLGRSKGLQFRPLSKIAFYIFVANFLVLMQLGAKHVESPFIEFGQLNTGLYFAYFIFIVPVLSILENTLIDLSISAVYSPSNKNYGYITNLESNIGKQIKNLFILLLIWIFITFSFLISVAFAESSDSEDNSSEEDSSSEEDNNSEKDKNSEKDNNSDLDSDEDIDEHRRRSISMSDDLWSGDPKDIDNDTLKSFIENIEELIPDLEDNEHVQAWEERKSALQDELDRRKKN